jgi:hypothetical protein
MNNKSAIHTHFEIVKALSKEASYSKCKACNARYGYKTGYGTLINHLRTAHPNSYKLYCNAQQISTEDVIEDMSTYATSTSSSSNSSSCVSRKRKYNRITSHFSSTKPDSEVELFTELARMFAVHSLPYSFIKSEHFLNVVTLLRKTTIKCLQLKLFKRFNLNYIHHFVMK